MAHPDPLSPSSIPYLSHESIFPSTSLSSKLCTHIHPLLLRLLVACSSSAASTKSCTPVISKIFSCLLSTHAGSIPFGYCSLHDTSHNNVFIQKWYHVVGFVQHPHELYELLLYGASLVIHILLKLVSMRPFLKLMC